MSRFRCLDYGRPVPGAASQHRGDAKPAVGADGEDVGLVVHAVARRGRYRRASRLIVTSLSSCTLMVSSLGVR
jgi:hypothetical protein